MVRILLQNPVSDADHGVARGSVHERHAALPIDCAVSWMEVPAAGSFVVNMTGLRNLEQDLRAADVPAASDRAPRKGTTEDRSSSSPPV